MNLDMPLLCRDAVRRVLSVYMPHWESAAATGAEGDDEGAPTWSSGRYVVSVMGDSLRLCRRGDDEDDSMTVIVPPSGADPVDRSKAVRVVRLLRESVRTAMDPRSRAASLLLEGLMEFARDVAAAHVGCADRVQLNIGVGRPDAVRVSSDAGSTRGVLRDASSAWSERLSASPHRHAVADDPGGSGSQAGHVVLVQGAKIALPVADVGPVDALRRLATLPEHLRSPTP